MSCIHLIKRILLATGAALLPMHFAAAQGPWVEQPFRADPSLSPLYRGYLTVALPGPTSIWGLFYENLYHGGSRYSIVLSSDDGQTWQTKTVAYLMSIGAAGNSVLDACTTDGLHSWILLRDNESRVISLLSTATTPNSFSELPTPPQNARLVRFFTNEAGLLVGAAANATTLPLYRTTDGGKSWTAITSVPALANTDLTVKCSFRLDNSLWLATANGQLLRTSDQGLTWQVTTLPISGKPISIAFTNATNGLLLTDAKELSATTDGGKTWAPLAPAGTSAYVKLTAVPGTTGTYLLFNGYLGSAVSVDSGRSWQFLEQKIVHAAMAASSPTRLWSGTYSGGAYEGGLLYRASSVVLGSAAAWPQAAALAYPNPSTGQFQLAPAARPRHLTLTDALGRRQRELTLPAGATTLDLSGCRPGVYVLTSTEQGQTQRQTQRLVLTAP